MNSEQMIWGLTMIRIANWEDRNRIHALICDLEQEELPYERFCEIYRHQLESDLYCCLVFEQNQQVIALLNLRMEDQMHHTARIAEVLEFATDPACRSQGIGRQLFAFACDLAREKGCLQIELSSSRSRTGAHRFYLREGMDQSHYKFSLPLNDSLTEEIRKSEQRLL